MEIYFQRAKPRKVLNQPALQNLKIRKQFQQVEVMTITSKGRARNGLNIKPQKHHKETMPRKNFITF